MEDIAQSLRGLRYSLFSNVPTPVYSIARQFSLSMLYFLSGGKGYKVKVADIYPLQVEWERAGIDFTNLEAEFIKSFGQALASPKVVLDIGASIGEWSALAATLVGANNVHIFEPNPQSWKHVKKVFQLNSLPRPAGFFTGFAANSDCFDVDFLSTVNSAQWPSVVAGPAEFENLLVPKNLPTIKLDTYCQQLGVIPSVIKIDVEGAEGEVLRGSQHLLENYHPLIFLSLHSPTALEGFGDSKISLLDWLKQQGYDCQFLSVDHEEHWLCIPEC